MEAVVVEVVVVVISAAVVVVIVVVVLQCPKCKKFAVFRFLLTTCATEVLLDYPVPRLYFQSFSIAVLFFKLFLNVISRSRHRSEKRHIVRLLLRFIVNC